VVKLDRLTRSVRDLGHLLEHDFGPDGAALLSVSENIDTRSAAGRLLLNVLASVAQWERETTSERTRAALAHKRTRRQYTGGRTPYGWRLGTDGATLEPDLAEQHVIREAQLARSDGLSYREVVLRLDRLGYPSREGTPLSLSAAHRMIAAAP